MKKIGRAVAVITLAMASTLAILLVEVDLTQADCFLFFIRDTLRTFAGNEALAAALFLGLLWLYGRVLFHPIAWRRGDRTKVVLLSAFFAFVAALGASYRMDDGQMAGFLTFYHLVLLMGKWIGFFMLAAIGLKALLMCLPKLGRKAVFQASEARAFSRKTFLLSWALICLAWLPSFIARYPGALSMDASRALQQFYGEIMPTADHPQAYTWVLGLVVWLGARIGGDNFGIFLCTLLQWLFLSGVMAYGIALLKSRGVPSVACLGLLMLYALLPLSMYNAAVIIKDIPYAAAYLAYGYCAEAAFTQPVQSWKSARWKICYALFSLMVLLTRHNGVLVVLPMTAVLAARFFRAALPRPALGSAYLTLPLALMVLFNTLVVPHIAYSPESTPDLMGVAFQQTARILRNSPDDLTDTEKTTINALLDVNELGIAYAPKQSDSVRKLFRYFNGHTPQDVLRFTAVWARLAVTHPLTSFHAFWTLSEGYFDPFDNSGDHVTTMPFKTNVKYPHALDIGHPDSIRLLQERIVCLEESYRELPFVSQGCSIGFYTWLMLIGWFLIGRTRESKLGWLLLPSLMTLLTCLFSVGFIVGSRYALPFVYAVPYLLCVFLRPVLSDAARGAAPATVTPLPHSFTETV